ncbi:MAG: DEAD/DEAH box helicase, partial [Muribaculaceae bacterium]|nr:DEAD/DEAH box helicase [Muribaculaceae bacterium]
MTRQEEIKALKEEIEWLKDLLRVNGIHVPEKEFAEDLHLSHESSVKKPQFVSNLSLQEKVTLFQNLFKGREDVFAKRWFSNKTGKSGYQPVCLNEWDPEYCNKTKYKCSDCPNRKLKPLEYEDYYKHLEGKDPNGKDVIGVYAILPDETCNFLCCDFDDKNCEHGFQEDVKAYIEVCKEWNIPAYIERSRSGNGAHVWILFTESVKAIMARRLGNTILTEAMERKGMISFKSYDRFFPNQDTMPNGGFGNLVALPLQGQARKTGNSIFLDENFEPYPDQWEFLQNIKKIDKPFLESLLFKYGSQHDMGNFSKSSETEPWERPIPKPLTSHDFPSEIKIVKENGIYIPIKELSGKVINYIKRIAAFKNPDFYAKVGMRLPVFNIPRIISCSEIIDDYLWLPIGCEESVVEFFKENNVKVELDDKSNPGISIEVSFKGELYPEQKLALEKLTKYNCGTLHASTAFGKTVTAAAIIAKKKVNTLILVHNKSLLQQWRTRLDEFLETNFQPAETRERRGRRKKFQQFGGLSSDENTLNGKIDIVLIQSSMEDNEVKPFVRNYGMVIVDECHHVPAVSFEQVLKGINARYVYGLTATPIRKDGHQPIIFMYCGEIRHKGESKPSSEADNFERLLIPRFTGHRNFEAKEDNFTLLVEKLSKDEARNQLIIEDVEKNLKEDRTPLILTDRTEHVEVLAEQCKNICPNVIKLVGNVSVKEKKLQMDRLNSISSNEPLVIVATGKYIGEGFDFARLD